MSDRLLTIGELARRAGVAPSAMRYWEELGLLPAAARIAGQRRYPESVAWLIGVILLLRDAGFALAEQKALMASRTAVPRGWQRLARHCCPLALRSGRRSAPANAASVRAFLAGVHTRRRRSPSDPQ
jgi:DNA-binding transcriptional MerR regulator